MPVSDFPARLRRLLDPRIVLPLVAIPYLTVSLLVLRDTVADPKGRADLVSGDAKHYLEIAEDFAGGNWSMDYVARRPHRQPLYSALISPVIAASGRDLFQLAAVNVVIATVALIVLYFAVLRFSASREIAAIITVLYAINPFVMAQTTRHFMTEPVHILLMIVAIFALLEFLQKGRAGPLIVAAVATGLDYLARPNGLFIMAAMIGGIVAGDLLKMIAARQRPTTGALVHRGALLAAAVVVFAVVATPSWLPRVLEYGKPLHHGYLANYMWVDTYEEGHIGGRFPSYTWRDYAATHTPLDAAWRMVRGIWNVGFAIPFRAEEPLPVLFFLALGGIVLGSLCGPHSARVLVIFGIVQLLPLMWTNLSNPNNRVPYAATFPLELALAAVCLMALRDFDWKRATAHPAISRWLRPGERPR